MDVNVGAADRIVRILAGFVLLMTLPAVMWWGFLGLIPLLSGLMGYCPLYSVLHVRTCGAEAA